MRIFILGLRRSGTTIFWSMFRQDPRLLCFNEPFNPVLRDLPIELPNGSRAEFIRIFEKDPAGFWRRFAPIGHTEELQEDLSDRQREFFRFLLSESESVALDATRLHFKVRELARLYPDAVCVHLHRTPPAFASSHLIPTGSGGVKGNRRVRLYGQLGFWTRTRRYNNWGAEEIVGRTPESLFGQRLREIGVDPEPVYRLPAVGRLLAYWRVAFERLEADGASCFGDRYLRVSFETFCERPRETIERVYAAAGAEPPQIDVSRVHPPNGPHRPDDSRWNALCDEVGIPAELRR